MMRNRVLTAALLLSLLPAALAGQTPDQRIEAARQRALQAGIPVALLESKVAEGRAKGVPAERIAAAVDARLIALQQAQAVLPGRATQAELVVGADAMQVGVSHTVLAALANRAQGEHRVVAIATLIELVQMGHAPDHALQRVTEALGRGPEALMNLPAQARAERRRGPPPGVPAAGQGKGGPKGGPPAAVPPKGRGRQGGKPVKPPAGPPGGI